MIQVEGDAPLVGGVGPPVQGLVRGWIVAVKRANLPGWAAAGRLDLHHIGAQVAQDLSAEQPALVGQVQHPVGTQQHVV